METNRKQAPPVAVKAPGGKIIIINPLPSQYTPMRMHLSPRPPDEMILALKELKPDGNPRPELVEICKKTALDMVALYPGLSNLEVRLEICGTDIGSQVMAQVSQSREKLN